MSSLANIAARESSLTPLGAEMVGELGRHLVIIGRSTATRISQRGVSIRIVGAAEDVALAERVVQQLYAVAASGSRVAPVDVDQACRLLRAEPEAQLLDYQADTILIGARKKPIFPRTPMQRRARPICRYAGNSALLRRNSRTRKPHCARRISPKSRSSRGRKSWRCSSASMPCPLSATIRA